MNKLIKDGKVAVLVSHGYGAGWSTWSQDETRVFNPRIAAAVIDEVPLPELLQIAKEEYPHDYLGGVDGLVVHWVPQGTAFRIHEYDGSESLEYIGPISYHVA